MHVDCDVDVAGIAPDPVPDVGNVVVCDGAAVGEAFAGKDAVGVDEEAGVGGGEYVWVIEVVAYGVGGGEADHGAVEVA